jgi:hypothetical protein
MLLCHVWRALGAGPASVFGLISSCAGVDVGVGYPLELVAGLRTLECPMSVMSDLYKGTHFQMYTECQRCVLEFVMLCSVSHVSCHQRENFNQTRLIPLQFFIMDHSMIIYG